jgi:hypothetical protein
MSADSGKAFSENTKTILVIFLSMKIRECLFGKTTKNVTNSKGKKQEQLFFLRKLCVDKGNFQKKM